MTADSTTRAGSPPATPKPTRTVAAEPTIWARLGSPQRTPLLLGLLGTALIAIGGAGGGGVLVEDPFLTNTALGVWRYGHGRDLAVALSYVGLLALAYAWMRLGRAVLREQVGGRAVLTTAAVWMLPVLLCPPLYSRDVYSYLVQGALPLAGLDPYAVGPEAIPGPLQMNVSPVWQETPAPYGPVFILVAKAVAAIAGDNLVLGVLLMRLALLPGLALLVWSLPELTRRMGGRIPTALWIAVANPIMIVHMLGGPHNDLLVVGLLTTAALLTLRGQHVGGIAVATTAVAVKASAGLALPFLVLIWARSLDGPLGARIARAGAAGVAVFVAVFAGWSLLAGVGLGWLSSLGAAATIIHWYSLPTGLGMLLHAIVGIVFSGLPLDPFLAVTRGLGVILLLVVAFRQWWAARDGGPEAVRRAGVALLAVAVLGPTLLSWYPSWGMALLAATAWTARRLGVVLFWSLFLMVITYPDGTTAQTNVVLLIIAAALWALAAVSLRHPDPLRLRERWSEPSADLVPAGAEPRGG